MHPSEQQSRQRGPRPTTVVADYGRRWIRAAKAIAGTAHARALPRVGENRESYEAGSVLRRISHGYVCIVDDARLVALLVGLRQHRPNALRVILNEPRIISKNREIVDLYDLADIEAALGVSPSVIAMRVSMFAALEAEIALLAMSDANM
jgi:hypothetical protein